jgi:pyruvate dehydrogenase E2 component (dihydrolipoamide acetyltransferase)
MNSKKKALMAMWSHPFDPIIYGTVNLKVDKLQEFLKNESQINGRKIGITVFILKVMSQVYKKFPQLNGHITFGKFLPKDTVDISCMVSVNGGKGLEMITINECDNKSLLQISKEVNNKKEIYEENSDAYYNRKLLIAKTIPTLYIVLI